MLKRVRHFILGLFLMWALLCGCATVNAKAVEAIPEQTESVPHNIMHFYNDTPFTVTYTIARRTIVPFYRDRERVYSGEVDKYSNLSFYHPCGSYIIVIMMNRHFAFHPYQITDSKPTRITLRLNIPMYRADYHGTGPNTYHLVKPGSSVGDGP